VRATFRHCFAAFFTLLIAALNTNCHTDRCPQICLKYYDCLVAQTGHTYDCEQRTDATCQWSPACADCIERSTCQPTDAGYPFGTFPDCLNVCPNLPP